MTQCALNECAKLRDTNCVILHAVKMFSHFIGWCDTVGIEWVYRSVCVLLGWIETWSKL